MIALDPATQTLLQLFKDRNSLSLIELSAITNVDILQLSGALKYLLDNKYAQRASSFPDDDGDGIHISAPYEITYEGRVALEQTKHSNLKYRLIEFRNWATLAIALCALVLSILK